MEKVNLLTRNINCSTLNENQFVQMMFSDMLEAQENFQDMYSKTFVTNCIKNYKSRYNSIVKNAKKFAEKKWKTEKRRNQYIIESINNSKDDIMRIDYYSSLSFFDFNVFPGSMGISYDCILSYKDLTFDKLHKCFNCIKDSKYFKHAKGWRLVYHPGFRSQIELILDDEYQQKADNAEKTLSRAIEKFYEGTNYWGD